MSYFLQTLIFVTLCVIAVSIAQEPQETSDNERTGLKLNMWIPCDSTVTPKKSCYNCRAVLVCKDYKGKGGEIQPCNNKKKPYCNLGKCAAIPSRECLKY